MSGQGGQAFVDEVTRFAAEMANPQVAAIVEGAEGIVAPLRVAVCGRRGVGRRTVTNALKCVGTTITSDRAADLVVYVIAEVAKPEDATAVAAVMQPVLVVLNKSDLTGRAAATAVSTRLAAPVEPMAALLAVAALDNRLDGPLWAALQELAAEPADLSRAERFVTGAHPVPRRVRQQLCDTLDLPGITHALAAVRQGRPAAQVRTLLRRLSGIDAVARRVSAVGAAVGYQRLLDTVARLEALAVSDGRISDFLSCDDTVVARMAAAVEVVEAAGLALDALDTADAPTRLRQAARWQHYSRGPVAAVHHACGTDIARGLLRLWSRAGGPAQEPV